MSSYMVSSDCLTGIVNYINHQHKRGGDIMSPRPLWNFITKGNCDTKEAMRLLGQGLVDMNRAAVNDRYRETENSAAFEYVEKMPVNVIKFFKLLGEYLYQCAEGDIPKMELFQEMDKIYKQTAVYLATSYVEKMEAERVYSGGARCTVNQ